MLQNYKRPWVLIISAKLPCCYFSKQLNHAKEKSKPLVLKSNKAERSSQKT